MAPILGIYASQISGHLWAPSGAYDSIATTTVGAGGASSITFSSIPQSYTHLQIRGIAAGNGTQSSLRFNSDSGNNYANHGVFRDASTVIAYAGASESAIGSVGYLTNVSNVFVPFVYDILDYTNTSKNKTTRGYMAWEANTSGNYIMYQSGLWANTSAINTIVISANGGGTIGQYSSYALYGIKGN